MEVIFLYHCVISDVRSADDIFNFADISFPKNLCIMHVYYKQLHTVTYNTHVYVYIHNRL